jgi:hypothetical protein
MRTSTSSTAVLALAAIASAAPHTKRQNTCIVQTVMNPNTDQVAASINQWNTDVNTVNTVNTFLNNAPNLIAANDPDALASATMTALTNAQDEPCQLMTLASQSDFSNGPAAFTCAVQDLMNVFQQHVLDNLMNIIANPGDTTSVQSAVDDINGFRCCNVLPDASILWLDSADDNGISNQVPIAAAREDACSSISCTPFCDTLDNGSNGK